MVEKRIIKSLIVEKQDEIPKIPLVKRPLNLDAAGNYVFIGLRRAGKSYLLYQHIQDLLRQGTIGKDNILYVNFEDERIASVSGEELGMFIECYKEMYDARPWIFLDEIQNIEGWEKFARRLADSKYKVFITGSNAKMLSREIYTTLGGRFIAHEVFPFSFQEYLSFNEVVLAQNWEYGDVRAQVVKLFQDYFYFGGFAESFIFKDKRSWINSLYQKILLGDVVFRNSIRNENAIRVLVKKLAESIMQPSSLARIRNIIDSTGTCLSRNTLVDYIRFLEDACLVFGISNFSDKLSSKETLKKRYFWDNGLLNNFLFEPEAKLLENLVAITLKKRYGDELYYYNRNIEVDFFIPKAHSAVQVSYSIANAATLQREVKALVRLSERHALSKVEIVTWDEEATITEGGLTIQAIPVWKWLLAFSAESFAASLFR
ncbi:MAG: ATP-binding protein [Prevotellaceae bacterium]|jgi:predicted AAA+ superfamily ATPase|nr:ATP-binding protein [Prevotellaceae bacterium]